MDEIVASGSLDGNEHWPLAGAGSRPVTVTRREPAPMRALAAVGFLLDAARRRRSGRMALWSLVVGLAAAGVFLLSYPLITDLWAHRIQGGLEKQFKELTAAGVPGSGYVAKPAEGRALTRLRIPKLGVNVIVVEGVSGNALRAGAGHYPDTALPGDPTGNAAIAGHRTGFGQPFRHLERLREGDRIELITPFGTFVYRVVGPFDGHKNPWVTKPTDLTVIGPTPEPSLTLTTCDPPHTSKNRLIVRARLVASP